MLNEKQLATIVIKLKIKGISGLRKKGFLAKDRESCRGIVLDYMVDHPKFTRLVAKSGLSIENVVSMAQYGK